MGGGDRAEQDDGVEIDVRVEPGQRERGEGDRPHAGRLLAGGVQRRRPPDAAGGERGVAEQERGAGDPDAVGELGHAFDHGARAGDAERDQDGVADRADRDHDGDVLAADALAQHERVLGADRDDQREAEAEAGEGGEQVHAHTIARDAPKLQLQILQDH